jgi:valyl-tRNA synthetase
MELGKTVNNAIMAIMLQMLPKYMLFLLQETTKPVVKGPHMQAAVMACRTLLSCLDTALHALSPFMPFLTEELYQHLPRFEDHHCSDSIVVAPYPTSQQVQSSVS